MHFTTVFTTVTVLALSSVGSAAGRFYRSEPSRGLTKVAARQGTDNPRMGQFRVYSAPGCSEMNEGFYTIDQDQAGVCGNFTAVPTGVYTARLEQLTEAANGCNFYLYASPDCSTGRRALGLDVCSDVPIGSTTWNSWELSCPDLSA